jgi:hypothetical protein
MYMINAIEANIKSQTYFGFILNSIGLKFGKKHHYVPLFFNVGIFWVKQD